MKTGATTGSGYGPRTQRSSARSAVTGQWWKVWVLLTSLSATVLGWMAFTMAEPPANLAIVAPDARPVPTEAAPVRHASGLEQPRPLPAMPQKPIFQAPVTRTRRS